MLLDRLLNLEAIMNNILVVDDEIDILLAISIILSNGGYKVKTIPRWENMSACIKNYMPDLILMDVSLSGADGRDLCIKLKNSAETMHIPIVLVSAHYDLINNLGNAKPDAIIAKPFTANYLIETVGNCLMQ